MLRYCLPLLILVPLASCAEGLCGNQILQSVTSPDGRYAAVIFERDCGATTAASYQISILPAGETPSGAGNVFIAEPGNGLADRPSVPAVEVAWLNPHRLRVLYRPDDKIFEHIEDRDGVHIEYGQSDP